ncbi:metallophosphoesterase family protein [Saccharothrix coeruleofusca]|uniref:Metallophosphoesterase n=1 Tax=Saccharothrix coeruleofusca TaxID=33919 RepID=A0A918AQH5_9PSEU|nr:metallophosphoesterase [Saccharothrix coeruleofusca]MBP2337883.1 3',5'-cyclic AMP phosphodiesterase CpdA [Saccharothrix coeruleofusca]GGP62921.1 metallophosphoesterase [Saccharothrix coeruleofusca]
MTSPPRLLATSDLHVTYQQNRDFTEAIRPHSADDWLIVAGDVAEKFADIEWALTLLSKRFHTVVWSPGNHELWTTKDDAVQARGEVRYKQLVELCRSIGVRTPEDEFPVFEGAGGPVAVAPLFTLYDYTFRPAGTSDKRSALAAAERAGVICTDEYFLHPDPHPSREAWCLARVAESERRLAAVDPSLRTVLINHWPLVREPTRVLRYPEFALWCGTERTADWHLRFRAAAAVYGHLHIPRTIRVDGVRFDEVSLGYPREWQPRGWTGAPLLDVLREGDQR